MGSIGVLTKTILAAGLLLTMLPAGCGGNNQQPVWQDDGRPKVVATTTMIGDLVRQIAGERVQLRVLMGPGTDPHDYNATMADMALLRTADRILYNGHHLEGTMVEILGHTLAARSAAVAERLPREALLEDGGAVDPHVWFDVSLWRQVATAVADELVALVPDHADELRQNLAGLDGQLAELDSYVRQQIERIPPDKRALVTSHDAYSYFGRAYGMEVHGIQGLSTTSEAGLRAIQETTDFVVSRQIPAIFIESSVPATTIRRVQADARARGFEVKLGGMLYSDAMGAPGEQPGYDAHTYLGMMRYNVDTIRKGLLGE